MANKGHIRYGPKSEVPPAMTGNGGVSATLSEKSYYLIWSNDFECLNTMIYIVESPSPDSYRHMGGHSVTSERNPIFGLSF